MKKDEDFYLIKIEILMLHDQQLMTLLEKQNLNQKIVLVGQKNYHLNQLQQQQLAIL
jgi:hypothetical protein